jgi:predicted naringenin-chalcone synthase
VSKIISIATAVPPYRHSQDQILQFMQDSYAMSEEEKRKLRYLYHHSGIDIRYSVIPDYSRPMSEWKFYPHSENLEPFPPIEQRMDWFAKHAAPLSVVAIRKCLENKAREEEITHLITVSCTGMSAPGLDLQVMDLMDIPRDIFRTSINFMGCYAAVHALRIADALCRTTPGSRVLIVCTELCTLHFQREATLDNIASSLLFADGSAAVLVTSDEHPHKGLHLEHFYGEVVSRGKKDMAWELSSTGFLMTLSGYVPELIRDDIGPLMERALGKAGLRQEDITHWCVHPGGKKILEAVEKSMHLHDNELQAGHQVLRHYGNMSSPTILFVLRELMLQFQGRVNNKVFGLAFGPGLTMETFLATN